MELQGLLDIVKTQFVDGLRLQELILKKLQAYFLRNLDLKIVEVDEIWSYIKKAKKCKLNKDSEECGDVYSLTAIKSDTRVASLPP